LGFTVLDLFATLNPNVKPTTDPSFLGDTYKLTGIFK